MSGTRLAVVSASVRSMGATSACQEIAALLAQRSDERPAAVLFFCSSAYDLDGLGQGLGALGAALGCPIIGCTTAGQIGLSGFIDGGLEVIALYSAELTVTPYLIHPLDQVPHQALAIAEHERASHHSRDGEGANPRRSVGLLLVDGLSLAEEGVAATLHHTLGGIQIIGGSAADNLQFKSTKVYYEGRFLSGAAVLALFDTTLPFSTFKFQHFVPTGQKLVITGAHPEARIVTEISGLPAAEAYADAINVPRAMLSPRVFSQHPVMLKCGGDYYVRAIQSANTDGSLTFFCAIEQGLVLSLGRGVDVLATADHFLARASERVGQRELIIGCDCILRRLELEQSNQLAAMGDLYSRHRVFGFSTYGEQFNGLHINQTFTGVAFGG